MSIQQKEKIIAAQRINITLPINLSKEDAFLFENDLVKELPEVNLFYFKNVNVSPHGILFRAMHIYKHFLIWPEHKKEFNVLYLLRNYLKRKVKSNGPEKKYLICFDYWADGYFHWMCDVLPKLIISEPHLKNYALLLPGSYTSRFINESLQVFDIKTIVRFSDREYVKCATALVPERVTRSGDHNPEVMRLLRKKMLDHFKPSVNSSVPENIFISRAKSRGRFIKNETEVEALLKTFGFTTVYYEDFSFSEQINIAFNCKNMIGLHGANLTNVLFMQPNANLMELRVKNDNERNYYFLLASTFRVNYFYLQCEAANQNKEAYPDLYVDIASLEKEVKLMLTYQNK